MSAVESKRSGKTHAMLDAAIREPRAVIVAVGGRHAADLRARLRAMGSTARVEIYTPDIYDRLRGSDAKLFWDIHTIDTIWPSIHHAYTIGNESNYDAALAECERDGNPMRKTGKGDQGNDITYAGGCAWSEPGDAHAAAHAMTEAKGRRFAVYRIRLPGRWDDVVYARGDDHNLLHDAVIVGKDVQP